MHTVPEGYLEAFAVQDQGRRTPGVWRYERLSGQSKVVGVRDAEVARDIYTVVASGGSPDTGIEAIFCKIESAFCAARRALLHRAALTREHWAALFRFVATQLLRTPRSFEAMQTSLHVHGDPYKPDDLRGTMLILIERWIRRLARMRGIIAYSETSLPLLTSDNPVATWKRTPSGPACGVTQYDPGLVVSCPLSPGLAFIAYQTNESLQAVLAEQFDPETGRPRPETFRPHVDIGGLPEPEVKFLNQICVANAHRHIYAGYRDKPLLRFLENRFFSI